MRSSTVRTRVFFLASIYACLALVAHATGKPDPVGAEVSDGKHTAVYSTLPKDNDRGTTRLDGAGHVYEK